MSAVCGGRTNKQFPVWLRRKDRPSWFIQIAINPKWFFFCFFFGGGGVTAGNFPSFLCRPKTVVISGFLSWGGGASECILEFLLLLLYNNGAVFVKTRLWLGWGHKGTYDARIPNKNRKFSIIFITGKRQNMKILIPRTDFIIFFVAIFLADNETFLPAAVGPQVY